MSERDDLDWADALAGRPREGASAETLTEAAVLRQAMRRWPVEVPALELPSSSELIARARREGELAPRRAWCAGCLGRWRSWAAAPLPLSTAGLALASLLGLWIVPWLVGQQAPEDPGALRAPTSAMQLRQAADPKSARDSLADRLQALQLQVRRYERLGRFGIDADLPRPASPALAALLLEHQLASSGDGSLRVEFEALKGRP